MNEIRRKCKRHGLHFGFREKSVGSRAETVMFIYPLKKKWPEQFSANAIERSPKAKKNVREFAIAGELCDRLEVFVSIGSFPCDGIWYWLPLQLQPRTMDTIFPPPPPPPLRTHMWMPCERKAFVELSVLFSSNPSIIRIMCLRNKSLRGSRNFGRTLIKRNYSLDVVWWLASVANS